MGSFKGHLTTICHHRRLVRKYCFRLGLYWQGLTHDLSKFSPVEFWVGVRYFQGDHSPNEVERIEKGYSSSWLHHKGRNKHHLNLAKDTPSSIRRGGIRSRLQASLLSVMKPIAGSNNLSFL